MGLSGPGVSELTPMQRKIAELWTKNLPEVLVRVALLERAAEASPLGEALRVEAMGAAHKLAGSLGMYGFAEGSVQARGLEQALEGGAPDAVGLRDGVERLRAALKL